MVEVPQFSPETEIRHVEQKIFERTGESLRAGVDHADATKEDIAGVLETYIASIPHGEVSQSHGVTQTDTHEKDIAGLLSIAFADGITEAVHRARSLKNPHLLKELHNALTDAFYDRLLAAGKIEKQ